jgi:hypothetical protein
VVLTRERVTAVTDVWKTHGGGAGRRAQVLLLLQQPGRAGAVVIIRVDMFVDLLVQDTLHCLPLEQDGKPERCHRKQPLRKYLAAVA